MHGVAVGQNDALCHDEPKTYQYHASSWADDNALRHSQSMSEDCTCLYDPTPTAHSCRDTKRNLLGRVWRFECGMSFLPTRCAGTSLRDDVEGEEPPQRVYKDDNDQTSGYEDN